MTLNGLSFTALVLFFTAIDPLACAAEDADRAATPTATKGAANVSTPLDDILKSQVGSVARASVYLWRQKTLLLSFDAGQLVEMNAFESKKFALMARFPGESMTFQLGLSRIFVAGTDATDALELTPYRQAGRPSRYELDSGIDLTISEGVANQLFDFYPLGQMVLSFQARLRYLIYPTTSKKGAFKDKMRSLFAVELSDEDFDDLSRTAPAGMAVERGRLNALVGLRFDHYAVSGFSLNANLLLALPLRVSDNDELKSWWEMAVGVGYGL